MDEDLVTATRRCFKNESVNHLHAQLDQYLTHPYSSPLRRTGIKDDCASIWDVVISFLDVRVYIVVFNVRKGRNW